MPYRDYYGQNYEDTPRRRPDVRKAQRLLGFSADTAFDAGLRETIDWCREHYTVAHTYAVVVSASLSARQAQTPVQPRTKRESGIEGQHVRLSYK